MSAYTLCAEERSSDSNSSVLRKEGKLPAVLYTTAGKATSITLLAKETSKLYNLIGNTTLVDLILTVEGKEETIPVLLWDSQVHPVKDHLLHVDLYAVDMEKEVTVRVPLVFTGVPKSIKLGAKLEIYREYLDIKAKPKNLVSKIQNDISDIDTNEKLFINDIILPENVTAVYKKNVAVLSLTLKEDVELQAKA